MSIRIEDLRQEGKKIRYPRFKAGQTVRVHQRIVEGEKERIQIFEGLIIAVNGGKSLQSTITVRKISQGIGVEQGFAVHSPVVAKIDMVREGKVRRSKIYFMRNLQGKAARLKERFYTEEEISQMRGISPEREEVAIEEALIAEEEVHNQEKDKNSLTDA
jgi:large subunit ribosomal protein L19